eukprot:NODE_1988_length_683_cov_159.611987_g1552_i0.p1 GENE.NODE_1988_length_683_cov_159.611987_g1552_i0~~NODE_1988_length_683_cov_159.611987_g1552_i0.p1  ORF type:complete len:208 (+),score=32.57 NODE_1988_length_683_cov_159.611987_g1552_i0:74-625(+)
MGGEGGGDLVPLFNGVNNIRSIKWMRCFHRAVRGAEQVYVKRPGMPLHPWSMYTEKGGKLHGVGSQLTRNFWKKLAVTNFLRCSVAVGIIVFYYAAGARAKTMTREWKEAEVDFRYPFEAFPDIVMPPDITKDPNDDCWLLMERVALRPPRVLTAADLMRRRRNYGLGDQMRRDARAEEQGAK